MEASFEESRRVRAARNQSMFRAVNERLREMNEGFSSLAGTSTITCECADPECVEPLEITPDEYAAVRHEAAQFAVLPGHVYPDVERVVQELDGHTVVEKIGVGSEIAAARHGGD